ncbi:hypothetical protein A3K73_08465 [Candidatus Pacearchaeota archaeon RBG_13_36_9]|nr:MAG: hypothetical protein A3K73_08465 [Candidatus Pacearchaeota archaeon RBG_13_36_9]
MGKDYLTTIIQEVRTNEDETTSFLLAIKYRESVKLKYDVPLPLSNIVERGDRVVFCNGGIPLGQRQVPYQVEHEHYESVAFFQGRKRKSSLSISGKRLALFEKAIRENKEGRKQDNYEKHAERGSMGRPSIRIE